MKASINRLKALLARMMAHEAHAQIICGDCKPDSIRADEAKDAAALRKLLAAVGVAQ
jgi:hypothetical protein